MGFKCGILGLPNVGKSTLFNAITKSSIPAENFPFCTIEPNLGIVNVPDKRLDSINNIVNSVQEVKEKEFSFYLKEFNQIKEILKAGGAEKASKEILQLLN